MNYPKILTVQDISCVGQCSLTVALPVISACGAETCVLPSAVLSTHTGGFKDYTFRDLTDDMPLILEHWKKEKIQFDAVYTGYLGSARQIGYVKDIAAAALKEDGILVVDPAMADNGKLYPGFDENFVCEMKSLCAAADYLLPNITEACLLTGTQFKTHYNDAYTGGIAEKLLAAGAANVILTGVSYKEGKTGVAVYGKDGVQYYEHELLGNGCHGTGDIYASAFTGALMRGAEAFRAASIAADFVVDCIKATAEEPGHWYGAKFETELVKLIGYLDKL